nr:hypothetical protein GCM10020092_000120 [Actinoplanes digitatis]
MPPPTTHEPAEPAATYEAPSQAADDEKTPHEDPRQPPNDHDSGPNVRPLKRPSPPTEASLPPETGRQSGPETAQLSGPESGQQSGPQTAQQSGPETAQQSRPQTGQQAGAEAAQQFGPETGREFGLETGPVTRVDAVWPGLLRATRDGGGNAIRTGRAGPAARGLARAAMRLDAPALREILEASVADRGVVAAWEEVIKPVLIGIGDRYAATKRFIEVEHLISRSITEVLGSVPRPPGLRSPQVLLAAADEEQHTLPLEALAAALAEVGVPSRLLGARVPPQALSDAVSRTGPVAVVLWSHLPSTGSPEQWVSLLTGPHRPLLAAAAGPGWPRHELPEDVTPLDSLPEAVRLVSLAAPPANHRHNRRSEP